MSSPAPDTDAERPRKRTRVRTGCLTCRIRKKKCDEERSADTGSCKRCRQGNFVCLGFPKPKPMTPKSEASNDTINHNSITSESPEEHKKENPSNTSQSPEESNKSTEPQPGKNARLPCGFPGECFLKGQCLCSPCGSCILGKSSKPVRVRKTSAAASEEAQNLHTHTSSQGSEADIKANVLASPSLPTSSPPTSPPSVTSKSTDASTVQPEHYTCTSSCISTTDAMVDYYCDFMVYWLHSGKPSDDFDLIGFRQHARKASDSYVLVRGAVAGVALSYTAGGHITWPADAMRMDYYGENLRRNCSSVMKYVTGAGLNRKQGIGYASWAHDRQMLASLGMQELFAFASNSIKHMRREKNAQNIPSPVDSSEIIQPHQANEAETLLFAAMNLALVAYASVSVQAFFERVNVAREIVTSYWSLEAPLIIPASRSWKTLGLRLFAFADVTVAVTTGNRPTLTYAEEKGGGTPSSSTNELCWSEANFSSS